MKDIVGWPEDKGRDGERKPMQWNSDNNAGFSTSRTPWLPVSPGFQIVNAAAEARDPASILNYYRALIQLPALRDGDFALVNASDLALHSGRAELRGGTALAGLATDLRVTSLSFGFLLLP